VSRIGLFILAAGGTGGHLFPAEALAAELIANSAKVRLVTEARAHTLGGSVPDLEVCRIRTGRPGGGLLRAAWNLTQLAAGTAHARRLLSRLQPSAVIGFGGYPSLPTMLAAVSLGLPTAIHEQNAVLGRANRLLAPLVQRIATGFPETAKLRPALRTRSIYTGNPVRPAILALGEVGYQPPRRDDAVEILVLGGSQGAHILAEIVPAALAGSAPSLRARLRVSQQARPEDRDALVAAYAEAGITAEVDTFFTDVPQRLARAHLVICRAGASTVAELAAIGRPALLIPYPYATDDHQTANARSFAVAGGGRVIAQTDFRHETLAADLEELLADGQRLEQMARQAAVFARRDAARQLALVALSLGSASALQECAA
jgi:UDP-N-acetylglucosamine--N-acetylmuramyl-(pentapeptide) pyrophosphoryl-undecaprenol N-acetylglucosamine transferase